MRRILGSTTIVLALATIMISACQAYTIKDLPAGWEIDTAKIQGTLLPVLPSNQAGTVPAASDPNTWLRPIGDFLRDAGTNQWINRIEWVTTNASDSIFLNHNTDTGFSTNWILDGWIMPGANYKTIDAYTWKGKSGMEKSTRYTIFAVGYVPPEIFPILY